LRYKEYFNQIINLSGQYDKEANMISMNASDSIFDQKSESSLG